VLMHLVFDCSSCDSSGNRGPEGSFSGNSTFDDVACSCNASASISEAGPKHRES
jgi:hypothetical protein